MKEFILAVQKMGIQHCILKAELIKDMSKSEEQMDKFIQILQTNFRKDQYDTLVDFFNNRKYNTISGSIKLPIWGKHITANGQHITESIAFFFRDDELNLLTEILLDKTAYQTKP